MESGKLRNGSEEDFGPWTLGFPGDCNNFCFTSQCVDNIRCNGLMTIVFEENSKVTVPHMIK